MRFTYFAADDFLEIFNWCSYKTQNKLCCVPFYHDTSLKKPFFAKSVEQNVEIKTSSAQCTLFQRVPAIFQPST